MEIPPTLTPPVLRLLIDTFPESLPILYSLRNKAVTSLITDNPSNPSFVVATIQRRDKNNANTNENGGKLESFLVATDNIDAAARALPRGTVLFYVREDYVDAILRAWPGTPDPRPEGTPTYLFYRSLEDEAQPPEALTDGARVRKLTVDDADVVNKHWGRGGGMCREYIVTQIARQGGFGVETSSGELASWLVRTPGHDVRIVKPCRGRKCSVFGCKTQASFGEPGGQIMFCKKHSKRNHVNLASKQCAEPGCKKIPTFGLPGSHAVFCAAHKAEGYVYVHRKPCPAQGCKKMPSFGPPGLPPVYCKDHKTEGCVLYTKKICVHEGCREKPRWGLEGRHAVYCDKHKGPEHVLAAPPRKNKRSRYSSSSSSSSSSSPSRKHHSKRHRASRRSDSDSSSGHSPSDDSDM
eukprot:m51a1_g8743 hypothetical protein (409) ;mRNA; f:38875-42445